MTRSGPPTLALLALLALGCATPTPAERLPDAPLVLIYRTLAQGRERAEKLAAQRGEGAAEEGVLDLNDVGDMVDRLRGTPRGVAVELEGRIALFHPRTGEVETLDAFVPGAVPCDWSPDHTRLLVASRHRGPPRLYEYSTERRELAPALGREGHGVQISGSFGPDGRLAYTEARRTEDRLLLSVWTTERGGRPRLVGRGPHDSEPRWSPDGQVVVFESRLRNGQPIIKAVRADGDPEGEAQVIARGRDARFSPRGDWIVYSRERPEGWRLWRMRPDGTGKTALGHAVQGDADERHPTVSPDGNYVAYVAEEADRQQIRIRGMDGGGDRLLVEGADGTRPIW